MSQLSFHRANLNPLSAENTPTLWLQLSTFCLYLVPLGLVLGTASTDITMTSTALFFFAHCIATRDFSWLKQTWVTLAFVIWAYLVTISFFTLKPALALSQSLPFGRFALFAVALQSTLLRSSQQTLRLTKIIAWVSVFTAIDALIQYFIGIDLLGHTIVQNASWQHWVFPWEREYLRLSGLTNKLKVGGVVQMMVMPALVYLFLKSRGETIAANGSTSVETNSLFKKTAYFSAALSIIVYIPLTGERTSTLLLAFGCFLLFILLPKLRLPLLIAALIGSLALAAVFQFDRGLENRVTGQIYTISKNVLTTTLHQEKQNNVYTALFRTAWNIYLAHPIIGVGPKHFDIACKRAPKSINVMGAYENCNNSAQNMYLEFLANTGTIGTSLFLSLIGLWSYQFIRHRKTLAQNPLLIGVLVAFFLRIWPLITTTSFFFSWGGITFWWMGAWALGYIKHHAKN